MSTIKMITSSHDEPAQRADTEPNSAGDAERERIAATLSTIQFSGSDEPAELEELERIPPIWFDQIPDPSVREMVWRRNEARQEVTAPCMPLWAGHYRQSSTSSADQERIHPFLMIGDLPPEFVPNTTAGYHILASAGGLILLVKLFSKRPEPIQPVVQTVPAVVVAGRRRGRPKLRPPQGDRSDQSGASSSSGSSSSIPRDEICPICLTWETLLVFNPATSERRMLPRPSCANVEFASWDYSAGVQADMVAHGDQSYEVILTFTTFICIYKSSSKTWRVSRFPRPAPWGRDVEGRVVDNHGIPWGWVSPRAFVGGRLYFADVIPGARHAKYTLRTFEIDQETGTWTLHNSWSLRKRHWDFLSTGTLDSIGRELDGIRYLGLVDCLGEMYAVVPVRLNEHLTTDFTDVRTLEELLQEPVQGFDYMPFQFHIVRLQQGGDDEHGNSSFGHRVLRILLPQTASPIHDPNQEIQSDPKLEFDLRRQVLLKTFDDHRPNRANWFGCAAQGTVIFVACMGYLLEYDVVSGKSKTRLMRGMSLMSVPHMLYSPNVHIKP